MLRRTERILENIPVGSLGLIALTGCEELGKKVDDYLVKWRRESADEHRDDVAFAGYEKDTFLVNARVPRFGSSMPAFRALVPEKRKALSPNLYAARTCT